MGGAFGSLPTMSSSGQAGQEGALGSAGMLSGLAGKLSGMGTANLSKAGGYFSSLAGGNRAGMTQALQPDIQNINSVYGGTARTMSRFLRGPERDTQLAETERQRAGQIGSLFSGGRSSANSALAGMGSGEMGAGIGAAGGAGGIFSGLAKQGQDSQFEQAKLQQQAGQGWGGLMFNLLKLAATHGMSAAAG